MKNPTARGIHSLATIFSQTLRAVAVRDRWDKPSAIAVSTRAVNLPLIHSLARLALACLLVVPLCAQPQGRRQNDPPGGVPGAPSDRDQAASIARRATGGRVLGVKPQSGSQRVKILSRDGRVRVLEVDPRTGAVRP
jgi:hypothetical protein